MDKLIAYLNGLTRADQATFSGRCGTTVNYLRKACSIKQALGAELCVAIERESAGAVTRKHLHPDRWALIWPELVTHALRPDLYPNPTDGLPDAIRAQVEAGAWPPAQTSDERPPTDHEMQETA